jgi:hypothetical protein
MIYTHVLNRGGLGVRSPADRLPAATRDPWTPPASRPGGDQAQGPWGRQETEEPHDGAESKSGEGGE